MSEVVGESVGVGGVSEEVLVYSDRLFFILSLYLFLWFLP